MKGLLFLPCWVACGFCAAPAVAQAPSRPPSASSAADLLRPPGTSSYDKIDWDAIPPWRQTSFYGMRAQGQVFIFVVDCSGSMADDARLLRAKQEIRRSVLAMRWPQKFQVIFYNDRPIPMPGGVPLAAEADSKVRMIDWFRTIEPDGETDPRGALKQAISLRPDAIFLLSDGEFPDGTAAQIASQNARKVPIHCIDLSGGAAGGQLKRIARDSGGQYAQRP